MKRLTVLATGLLLATGVAGAGCTDNSGGSPGQAGSSGGGTSGQAGSGGGTGQAGAGGAGSGGGSGGAFMAVAPCNSASSYVSNTTTISFTGATTVAYTPNCLKITPGTAVMFMGDFGTHPLEPSALRGTTTGNPITVTSALPDGGTSKSFTFPDPGYYAYFCDVHGPSDSGAGMAGVIWVE